MRKNQVTIRIERFGDVVPRDYPKEERQTISVYADCNNLYEALTAAYNAAINEIAKWEHIGVCCDVTTNIDDDYDMFLGGDGN